MSNRPPERAKPTLKPFARFETDEEAERFVDTADLSEYDFSAFQPLRFEAEPKEEADT